MSSIPPSLSSNLGGQLHTHPSAADSADSDNPQLVVADQDTPYGIALDRRHVYWDNESLHGDASQGTIWVVYLDGGNPRTIRTGGGEPAGVATLLPVSS